MMPRILKQTGYFLSKNAPVILSCVSAVGVVATAVLAVKETPKALEIIQNEQHEDCDERSDIRTAIDTAASCWKCYIPAIAVGTVTIACIFGSTVLSRKQQASLIGAYSLLQGEYTRYRNKVRDIYGQEAHDDILRAATAEESNGLKPYVPNSFFQPSSLEFEDADEEIRLFYDLFSRRYFKATISQVLQAEYHVNRNLALSGYGVPVNEFYHFLGISPIPGGNDICWYIADEVYWADFNHTKTVMDDGLECYIIEMVITPGTEEDFGLV